jgi:hypothetical protein
MLDGDLAAEEKKRVRRNHRRITHP